MTDSDSNAVRERYRRRADAFEARIAAVRGDRLDSQWPCDDCVVSGDMVLHGWDLARATGQDDTIDPVELDRIWPGVKDIPDIMRQPEAFGPGIVVFGPIVEVSEDAPIQDQALGYLGRDPSFVAGPRSATA